MRRGKERWTANSNPGDVDGPGEQGEPAGGGVDEVEYDNDAHSGEEHEVGEELLHKAQQLVPNERLSANAIGKGLERTMRTQGPGSLGKRAVK